MSDCIYYGKPAGLFRGKHKECEEDFQKALVGFQNETERELLKATSPFVFHKINESVIFRFLKLLGCDKTKIGNYTKMVKDRNEVAHSNGNIFYSI